MFETVPHAADRRRRVCTKIGIMIMEIINGKIIKL